MPLNQKICAACAGKSKTKGGLNNSQLNQLNPKLKYLQTRKEKIKVLSKNGTCKKACKETIEKNSTRKTSRKNPRKTLKKSMQKWTFSANAYLLKENGLNEQRVSIPRIQRVIKKIHLLGEEIMKDLFSNEDFEISWNGKKIKVQFINYLNKEAMQKQFELIVRKYHEIAMELYISGDSNVYQDMEFILDDFEITDGKLFLATKNYWTS